MYISSGAKQNESGKKQTVNKPDKQMGKDWSLASGEQIAFTGSVGQFA